MAKKNGWLKIHRKIQNWEWYSDANTFRVFMHLLLNTNHEVEKFRGKEIHVGSLPTGRKKIASELGLSEQEIRTALSRLQSTNNITIKSTKSFSIISICNWEEYQDNQPTKGHGKQPPDNHNVRSKEVKKVYDISAALPDWLDQSVWQTFADMRKKTRKPMTEEAARLIVVELDKLRAKGHDPTAVVQQSIRNNWLDVYPLKEKQDGRNSNTKPKTGPSAFVEAGSDIVNAIRGDF